MLLKEIISAQLDVVVLVFRNLDEGRDLINVNVIGYMDDEKELTELLGKSKSSSDESVILFTLDPTETYNIEDNYEN